jgi:TRAP-type mannitol/chloroaromatic compound transport system permease small subunit
MTYCHGAAFLLALAYTLKHDEHVRVDIFYQRFGPVQKAWVNAIGIIVFALPFTAFLLFSGAEFFIKAWAIKEGSAEPGGLPFVYLLKGLIPLSMLLLVLELLLQLKKSLALLFTKVA